MRLLRFFSLRVSPFAHASQLRSNRSPVSANKDLKVVMMQLYTSLSTDELMTHVQSFNKQYVPQDQLAKVRALLTEVLERRTVVLNVKGFRDVLSLAHLSGSYSLCVEIFRKRFQTHSTDPKFTVYDVVVDSAYKSQDVAALEEIASICYRKLRISPREVIADFTLARVLWRCICIQADPEASPSLQSDAAEACERIWKGFIVPNAEGVEQRVSLQFVMKETKRHLLYSSADESGEMMFFQMCKKKGILRTSCKPLPELRNNETYYCALIRTCNSGSFADVAMEYFEEMRSAAHERGTDGNAPTDGADLAFDAATVGENSLFDSLGVESSLEGSLVNMSGNGMTEVVIFAVAAVLHAAKDHQRIVDMSKSLLGDPANKLSSSILATLAIAGGEVKDLEFVQTCYEGVMAEQLTLPKPNTFLMYSILSSISKCSVKDFKENYLAVCTEKNLITKDPETYTYLILQNAMGSVNPMAVAEELVQSAIENPAFASSLSIRVASLLLKILLRCEGEKFLDLYRRLVVDCGLFKQVWVEELLLWADRRRYFLSNADRTFILQEVKKHFRVTDPKATNLNGLEKLRTHLATLHHDAHHNSLERYRLEQWISPEPTVLDSRIHFIMKRKTCVESNPQEHLQRFVEHHPGIRKQHQVMAQTALASAVASPNEVTQDEFRFGLMDLLSKKQLEIV